jgi:hypothetical protein
MMAAPNATKTGNRRRWPRQPAAIAIRLHGVDAAGAAFSRSATTLDVSSGGSLVVVREQLPACASLRLEMPAGEWAAQSEHATPALEGVEARVVRVIDYGQGSLLGLEFQSPGPGLRPPR